MLTAVVLAAEGDPTRFVLPKGDELIWGSLAFFILFAVLSKVAFPAINKVLQQRSDKIRSSLESAERAKIEADGTLDQYRAQLADARAEASRIIEEAKRTAEAVRREIEARAQVEAQQIVERARAEVGTERDRALQELRGTVGDLSIRLATKVVERELANPDAQRAFVGKMIDELAATAPASGNGGRGGGA